MINKFRNMPILYWNLGFTDPLVVPVFEVGSEYDEVRVDDDDLLVVGSGVRTGWGRSALCRRVESAIRHGWTEPVNDAAAKGQLDSVGKAGEIFSRIRRRLLGLLAQREETRQRDRPTRNLGASRSLNEWMNLLFPKNAEPNYIFWFIIFNNEPMESSTKKKI